MPDGDFRGTSLNLGTIVTVVTMIAGLAGTWSVMGERIKVLSDIVRDQRADIVLISNRLTAVERVTDTLAYRAESNGRSIDDLRDDVNELRRGGTRQ